MRHAPTHRRLRLRICFLEDLGPYRFVPAVPRQHSGAGRNRWEPGGSTDRASL